MTSLEAALRGIQTALTEAHVAFALVGGLAVGIIEAAISYRT